MARGLEAVRRATVRICTHQGEHKGQGLLLALDGEGTIVLTCHHVIAGLDDPEDLCVAIPNADGWLGKPIPAQYDPTSSNPERDAVVLRIDGVRFDRNPWLHALNPNAYDGASQLPATGLTYSGGTRTFQGKVGTPTPLEISVETPGPWPNPPYYYRLPKVYPLVSTNTRPGISGSVLTCEDGVLGLVHFSRTEEPDLAREAYIVPLTVWAEKLPALAQLIEPFVDKQLRDATSVIKRARDVAIGSDIVVEEFRSDVYFERTVDSDARKALEQCSGVMIIGRPKSGKTRLLWQLLQKQPESLVVLPLSTRPPETFEGSSLYDHDLVLVLDDLHLIAETHGVLEWWERLRRVTQRSCVVICTTRDGKDWDLVREKQLLLLKRLGKQAWVYTSGVHADGEIHGEDLSTEEGWELAQTLGLNQAAFEKSFDGTPGSLTLDLEDMKDRYLKLRYEQCGGISMARLLDSAKVLHAARQPVFRARVLRTVAEQIRGNVSLSEEAWEAWRAGRKRRASADLMN